MTVLVHIDIEPLAGVGLFMDAAEASSNDHGLQKVWIRRAVRQPKFKATLARHAYHVRAIVARPGDGVWRPRRARDCARRIDPLVGVDGGVGDGRERLSVPHDAAEEMVALLRQ